MKVSSLVVHRKLGYDNATGQIRLFVHKRVETLSVCGDNYNGMVEIGNNKGFFQLTYHFKSISSAGLPFDSSENRQATSNKDRPADLFASLQQQHLVCRQRWE